MVVETVETDHDVVEVALARIAPSEPPCDRKLVVEHRPDIDRVVVEGDAELGTLGSRRTLIRIFLEQIRDDRSLRPHRLVETTIHVDGGLSANRPRPRSQVVAVLGIGAPLAGAAGLRAYVRRGRDQGEP